MAREYFCAYHSYLDTIDALNDAERGRLFTAALIYSATGKSPELRGNERFVFPAIKGQIDRDTQSYAETCKINSENGKKGGRPKTDRLGENRTVFGKAKKAKEKEKEKEKEKTKENNIPPISPKGVWGDVSPELKAALDEFAEMRRKIKKPLTDHAKGMLTAQLDKLAGDDTTKCAILAQSVFHCWQGVFPLKNDDIGTDTKNPYTKLLNEMQNGGDPF